MSDPNPITTPPPTLAAPPPALSDRVRDLLRAAPLLLIFLIAIAVVLYLNPVKAGLTVYGISKIALGAYLGYWSDRLCFRAADRPHRLDGISRGTAWKRRALIVAASIVAAAFIP